jgi:hypothetical protein
MRREEEAILALEQAAPDRWGKGDPSGFLEISAPEVVYFDNTLERRLDGLDALTSFYDQLRGKVYVERCDLLHATVQLWGDAAVLTYNFVGYAQGQAHRWNCAEVYRRTESGWRIMQTHWSITQHSPSRPEQGKLAM